MEVARDSAPLVEDRGRPETTAVAADLPRRASEDQEVRAEAHHVRRIEPFDVERWEE